MLPTFSMHRIARDVGDIMKHPMSADGIHYIHSDSVMTQGTAMLVGAEGTPYHHGCFFFSVDFPTDYPTSPPVVKALTQDSRERTRFHPNFYRNGKVCRAGLNTWRGEGWTSCMTLRTVLLDLAQAMNRQYPIIEEPDIPATHRDSEPYNKSLQFKTMEVAVLHTLQHGRGVPDEFKCIYEEYYNNHAEELLSLAEKYAADDPQINIYVGIYEMRVTGLYEPLLDDLRDCLSEIRKSRSQKDLSRI